MVGKRISVPEFAWGMEKIHLTREFGPNEVLSIGEFVARLPTRRESIGEVLLCRCPLRWLIIRWTHDDFRGSADR
jgi:hypothetical protein